MLAEKTGERTKIYFTQRRKDFQGGSLLKIYHSRILGSKIEL